MLMRVASVNDTMRSFFIITHAHYCILIIHDIMISNNTIVYMKTKRFTVQIQCSTLRQCAHLFLFYESFLYYFLYDILLSIL